MKSGCSGALKLGRLGLSCKAIKCSDTGTRSLGVLPIHATNYRSTRLVMPAQHAPSECRHKHSNYPLAVGKDHCSYSILQPVLILNMAVIWALEGDPNERQHLDRVDREWE